MHLIAPSTLLLALVFLPCCAFASEPVPTADTYLKFANEAEQQLRKNVLEVWFPRCVDQTRGGFDSSFARDWSKTNEPDAFVVFQSRMTWICATVAKHRPDLRDPYLKYARHGVEFLRTKMWDARNGGPFWELTRDGRPDADGQKHLYGIAFVIYAGAAAYDATHDRQALDLALDSFRWLDAHAHDQANGGYHEALARDGMPLAAAAPPAAAPPKFPDGAFPVGYKTMNAHIHLLEALTELYRVSKDPVVRQRLEEVLSIVRDKIATEPGCLNQFFTADWRPVPDLDSFGHDIETGFLMMEACDALGRADDAKTLGVARRLVDHALVWGWDERHGGFYDAGPALDPARDRGKTWWVQFEGLNALLLMHEHFGRETQTYWNAFVKTWRFIVDHMADPQFGGFYDHVEEDGALKAPVKAQNWKAAYHDGRALLNTADQLRKLAQR